MNQGRIGIDLGISFCCCGIYKSSKVELVPYNDGTRTIASHVYFNPDTPEIIVGNAAKYSIKSVGQSVYNIYRLMGKRYDDSELQEDIRSFLFKVVEGEKGEALVELKHNGRIVHLTANEIYVEILKFIKKTADKLYGQDPSKPTEAVITVPACFNIQQRQNMIELAKISNLKVIKIINTPTAAAIAYAYQRIQQGSSKEEETLLIYDFGGGTFDVSIIRVNFKTKKITVLGTDGDSHLGGEDIDQNLVEYFLQKYKSKCDKEVNNKKQFKLKKACERTKCLLSAEKNEEAAVDWEPLEDASADSNITRAEFDKINEKVFNRTMEKVDNVLNDSGLTPRDINTIILVGGSSRIPKVQELLKKKFPSTFICKDINPDEVVAYGACLYANLENMHFEVQDIITHTISTDVEEGGKTVLYPLIKRNTQIPFESEKPICFTNAEDNADHIDISVFEGEGKYPTDKGIRELKSVPFRIPKKDVEAGKYIIETRYKVDENGILTIEVKDRQTGDITTLHIEL